MNNTFPADGIENAMATLRGRNGQGTSLNNQVQPLVLLAQQGHRLTPEQLKELADMPNLLIPVSDLTKNIRYEASRVCSA